MKLNKLHEDYCPACGGWDKEQMGRGHNLGCPIGEPGTPIEKTEPEVEEGHAVAFFAFHVSDIEEVFSDLKGYSGTIVEYWQDGDDIVVVAMFDEMSSAQGFLDLVTKEIPTFDGRWVGDAVQFFKQNQKDDAQIHEIMHDYYTGKEDSNFVREYDLS